MEKGDVDAFVACVFTQYSFFVKSSKRVDCMSNCRLAVTELQNNTVPYRVLEIASNAGCGPRSKVVKCPPFESVGCDIVGERSGQWLWASGSRKSSRSSIPVALPPSRGTSLAERLSKVRVCTLLQKVIVY